MNKKLTSSLKGVNDVLHRIRLKLYPNHLINGRYHARTSNEKALTREEVCQSLKNRGGFTGNYNDLLDYLNQYYNEVAFLLCDGYAVNSGLYTIFPNIGGSFDSTDEKVSPKKHPLTYRIRSGRELKELTKFVTFEVMGLAVTNGYIRQFYDVLSDTYNDTLSSGDNFIITGDKIKVIGDDTICGVYFEATDGSGTRIKVEKRLIKNLPSEIVGTVPVTLEPMSYRVVVVTQFSSGSTLLKEPRTIISDFELDVT